MKHLHTSISAILLTLTLGACSDSDKQQASSDASLKTLFSSISEDTPYLMTNRKILPDAVRDVHLQRFQHMLTNWSQLLISRTDKEDSRAKDTQEQGENPFKFISALLKTYADNLSEKNLIKLGLDTRSHMVLYGYGLSPIFRMELADPVVFKATINQAATVAKFPFTWSKCANYDCIQYADKDLGMTFVVDDNYLVGSIFPLDKKQQILDHLLGKAQPKKTYTLAKWDKFLSDNKFLGYGDFHTDLLKVYAQASLIFQPKSAKNNPAKPTANKSSQWQSCSNFAQRLLQNTPEMAIGITQFDQNNIQYQALLNTSPLVSTALQKIPNPITGLQHSVKPIIDFGININLGELQNGLSQYTNYLISSAKETGCNAIKAKDISKAMGGFAMISMMGLNQFKTIYLALNDLTLNKQLQPEKIHAYGAISSDQPSALFSMLGMINPQFSTLQLPTDGTVTALPDGLLPVNDLGISADIYLSQTDKLLDIRVGDKTPKLKPFNPLNPTFLWSSMDMKRYLSLMSKSIEQAPDNEALDEETRSFITSMFTHNAYDPKQVSYSMSADSRGLLFNLDLHYEKINPAPQKAK